METIIDVFERAGVVVFKKPGALRNAVLFILFSLWALVLGFYIGAEVRSEGWVRTGWGAAIGLHVFELLLVMIEAGKFKGRNWTYSTFVIGNALIITA